MQSLAILNAAQTARMMTMADQANRPNPLREAVLELPRERNAMIDWLLYDLDKLHHNEAAELAPRYAAPGSVLLVGNSDHPDVERFDHYDDFRASRQAQTCRALIVAGGGSSALGAAAFARNVGDALDAPVLAVVSGYGLSDLMTEAMGGMLWFSRLMPTRHQFEAVDLMSRPQGSTFAYAKIPDLDGIAGAQDAKTVAAILAAHPIDTLVGHSKGNIVISDALSILADTQPAKAAQLAKSLTVIQISTRVALPKGFTPITIMGEDDRYGEMNSDKDIEIDFAIPGAWHHTNTELSGHLDVTNAVERAVKRAKEAKAA
ncbi:hypothetical protein V8J36_00440 [Frigidibacter sp. MR17.14]|uniref:hypothetical protein n=1 Tax=Frigidibacter sp. MR17.14 TaxID=3126509 RepID=UPI003012B622